MRKFSNIINFCFNFGKEYVSHRGISLTISQEMGFVLNFITTIEGTYPFIEGVLSYLPVSTRRLWQPILSFMRVLLMRFFGVESR